MTQINPFLGALQDSISIDVKQQQHRVLSFIIDTAAHKTLAAKKRGITNGFLCKTIFDSFLFHIACNEKSHTL